MDIKEIYKTLTGGKVIDGNDFIISKHHFSSILRDRFIAELKREGINWDGNDVSYSQLVDKEASAVLAGLQTAPTNEEAVIMPSTPGFEIGIDIQVISDLPDCSDFWEDTFYNSNFTPREIAYAISKERPKQTFAGIYSCKEALIKCNNRLSWRGIEITYNGSGRPAFGHYKISISHSGEIVVAVAIAIGGDLDVLLENGRLMNSNAATSATRESKGTVTGKASKLNLVMIALLLLIVCYLVYRDLISPLY